MDGRSGGGWTDGRVGGCLGGWADGRTDGWIYG